MVQLFYLSPQISGDVETGHPLTYVLAICIFPLVRAPCMSCAHFSIWVFISFLIICKSSLYIRSINTFHIQFLSLVYLFDLVSGDLIYRTYNFYIFKGLHLFHYGFYHGYYAQTVLPHTKIEKIFPPCIPLLPPFYFLPLESILVLEISEGFSFYQPVVSTSFFK